MNTFINFAADAADRPTTALDTLIGLIVIAVAVAVVMIGRSPTARQSVGRAAGRAAIGTVRATGRPIRALGRRSRSGLIGRWGRAVVGCEDRSIAAAAEGKHGASRFWRSLGDALVGSTRIACHVPDCTWTEDPPRLGPLVAHLRTHTTTPTATTPTATDQTQTGDQKAADNTTPTEGASPVSAESIPELAAQLDSTLIPAAIREADAAESAHARAQAQQAKIAAHFDTMSALNMPTMTLSVIQSALESATTAVTAADQMVKAMHEVREALMTEREAIRGQENVAEAAAAAGGAMHQTAYNQ